MSGSDIATILYGTLATIGTFVAVERLLAGHPTSALWPGAIAAFCIYRLFSREEE